MSTHLCAAIPNFRNMEIEVDDASWKDALLTWEPTYADGHLSLSPRPRLGGGAQRGGGGSTPIEVHNASHSER